MPMAGELVEVSGAIAVAEASPDTPILMLS
jgi:hypothetical protein